MHTETLCLLKLVQKISSKNAVLNLALSCGATEKNRNIGAQLQSILYTAAQIFRKIYFLYDFWCALTCYSELFLHSLSEIYCRRYIAKCEKMHMHIYVPCSKSLRYVYAQTFPPIFELFTILDRNFPKIVAPSTNKMRTI